MELTSLERAALDFFALLHAQNDSSILMHLSRVDAVSRENTGRGFRTKLFIDHATTAPCEAPPLLDGLTMPVGGLTLAFFLSFQDGYADLLEAFAQGHTDTRSIDFLAAPFDDRSSVAKDA